MKLKCHYFYKYTHKITKRKGILIINSISDNLFMYNCVQGQSPWGNTINTINSFQDFYDYTELGSRDQFPELLL